MQDQQKPPTFPKLPKSALFSKLEAFLPVMAEENKKLSEAVAAGEGAKHNIEVEENVEASDEEGDDAMTGDPTDKLEEKDGKAPVIEMNFALGMMEEDNDNGGDSEAAKTETQIKAAAKDSKGEDEDKSTFLMRTETPSNKPRPVIQELN